MPGESDHGLHTLVLGAALALAVIVLYYAGQRLIHRPVPAAPAAAPAAGTQAPVPGSSATVEAVSEVPPLMIQKAGRGAKKKGLKSKAPPSPKTAR